MNAHLGDVARVLQPAVRPAATGIGRAVNAVAVSNIQANGRLARASINHIRVCHRDGQGAN